MSASVCEVLTAELTSALATNGELRAQMRELAKSPVDGQVVCDLLAAHLDGWVAAELRAEFSQLPAILAQQLVLAFALADAGGKVFVFQSERPESALAYARDRHVRFSLDVTAERVTLGVAHVAGRKAAWYQPAAIQLSA